MKKGRRGCDAAALKLIKNMNADYGAIAEKSQAAFLIRRFGLPPLRAELVAHLVFGEARS